jgi:hypothetical protein
MGRVVRTVIFGVVACVIGAAAAWSVLRPARRQLPDGPIVLEKIREVARLETLEAQLYEVVQYKVDPKERSSIIGVVYEFAKDTYFPDEGRAVVFATAHVGFDLSKLDREHLRVRGDQVEVVLPPLSTTVELKPAETMVITSNLDSQQTMALLDMAKSRFESKVNTDAKLQQRARASGERAIQALLITMGYQQVHFVEALPAIANPG